MMLSDIQARLAEIFAAEEAPSVDWPSIDRLCEELDRQLEASEQEVPEIVAHFLSDADIRARDRKYGDAQRDAIRTYLATGDYFDGVAVPWWGCLALMAGFGGYSRGRWLSGVRNWAYADMRQRVSRRCSQLYPSARVRLKGYCGGRYFRPGWPYVRLW